MKPRVTINRRHTGRYYVGLDQDAFFELYGLVLLGESMSKYFAAPQLTESQNQSRARVLKTFKTFAESIKSKTSGPVTTTKS
jgi:hypothetical protein